MRTLYLLFFLLNANPELSLFAREKFIYRLPYKGRWADLASAIAFENRDLFERVPSIQDHFIVDKAWNFLLVIFFLSEDAAANILKKVYVLLVCCHSWTICETQSVVGWMNALVYIRYGRLRLLLCILGLENLLCQGLVRRYGFIPVGCLIGVRSIS